MKKHSSTGSALVDFFHEELATTDLAPSVSETADLIGAPTDEIRPTALPAKKGLRLGGSAAEIDWPGFVDG